MNAFNSAAFPLSDDDEPNSEIEQTRRNNLIHARYLRDCLFGAAICLMGTMTRTTGREALKDSSLVEAAPKELFEITYTLANDVKDMAHENADSHESDIGFIKVKHIKDRSPDVTWPLYLVIGALHLSGLDNQGLPRSSLISGEDKHIPLLERQTINSDEVGMLSAVIENLESLDDFMAACELRIRSYLGHVHRIEPYAMYMAAMQVYDKMNLAETDLATWFPSAYFQAAAYVHPEDGSQGIRSDYH